MAAFYETVVIDFTKHGRCNLLMKQVMTIPKDTVLKGDLKSKGKINVDGQFDGGGIVEGSVLVSRFGTWNGNIVADVVVIEGTVKGNIVGKQKVLMLSHARVDGTVYSANIHMDEGASITGKLQMKTPAPLGLQIDPSNYVPMEEIMSDSHDESDARQDMHDEPTHGRPKHGQPKHGQPKHAQQTHVEKTKVVYKNNSNVIVL